MGRVDFSKVEDQFGDGIRRITIDQLLFMADLATSLGSAPPEKTHSREYNLQMHLATLGFMKRDLTRLQKTDPEIWEKIELSKEEFKQILANAENLSDEEWGKTKEAREKLDAIKKEIRDKDETTDEEIIEKETKKGKQRRFNINEDWLPLH